VIAVVTSSCGRKANDEQAREVRRYVQYMFQIVLIAAYDSKNETFDQLLDAALKEDTDGWMSKPNHPQLNINSDVAKWKNPDQVSSEIAVYAYDDSSDERKVICRTFGNQFQIHAFKDWSPPANFYVLKQPAAVHPATTSAGG